MLRTNQKLYNLVIFVIEKKTYFSFKCIFAHIIMWLNVEVVSILVKGVLGKSVVHLFAGVDDKVTRVPSLW